MLKYKFSFERTYTITEGFERVVQAPSYEEAAAAAANLCREFDRDCPDDCSEIESGNTEIGDFAVVCPPADRNPTTAHPDYMVLPDRQCMPCDEVDWTPGDV